MAEDVHDQFGAAVNMTASELEKWLVGALADELGPRPDQVIELRTRTAEGA